MAEEGLDQEWVSKGVERGSPLENLNLLTTKISKAQLNPVLEPKEFRKAVDTLNTNATLLTEMANSSDLSRFEGAVDTVGKFLKYYNMWYPLNFRDIKDSSRLDIKIHRFVDFGVSLISNNLEGIDSKINNFGLEQQDNLISAVIYLGRVGKGENREKAVDFLLRHSESAIRGQAERGMGKDLVDEDIPPYAFGLRLPILPTILGCGNEAQIASGKKLIIKLLKDPNAAVSEMTAYNIPLRDRMMPLDTNPKREDIADIISAFGIDGEEAIDRWRSAIFKDREPVRASIAANLLSLLSIESQRPGIGFVLQSEFGVNDFARYPQELLIAQYDQRNDDSLPYGVIIYPQYDDNGAFYKDRPVFKALFDQLQGEYGIRVWEVKDLLELVNALNTSRHRYGKISFAIIGGHGTTESIQFGSEKTREGKLTQSHLGKPGASSLKLAFIDNPTIILDSCSTGELGAIGQEISRIGAKVIAPSRPTNPESIDTMFLEDGRIDFRVKYNQTPSNTYSLGEQEGRT